jgi:hypothetical protein
MCRSPQKETKVHDFPKDDRDVEIADLKAELATMIDARFRMEQRLDRVLRFLEDHQRALAELERAVHDALLAGGKW